MENESAKTTEAIVPNEIFRNEDSEDKSIRFQSFDFSDENTSNTGAWHLSKNVKAGVPVIEIPSTTSVTIALIIYSKRQSNYQKFRSTVMKNIGIMKAYGHGEFLGMALEDSINESAGCWGDDKGFGILSFDDMEDAEKFMATDTEFRNWLWLCGFYEIYLVPACQPFRTMNEMRYCSVELYDVKNGELFAKFVDGLKGAVASNKGLLGCGSSNVKYVKGIKNPRFIAISQWKSEADFKNYCNATNDNGGSAPGTRICAEMDPFLNI